MPTGKPQYRTLVKALDELAYSALDVLDANFEAGTLTQRNRRLRQAAEDAVGIICRANMAITAKKEKQHADKRRDTSSYTKHRSGEL